MPKKLRRTRVDEERFFPCGKPIPKEAAVLIANLLTENLMLRQGEKAQFIRRVTGVYEDGYGIRFYWLERFVGKFWNNDTRWYVTLGFCTQNSQRTALAYQVNQQLKALYKKYVK